MKVYQSQCFVYKWIHLPTGKWYIGSRTAKNCHINDGYICSSKEVKRMIIDNKINWKREVLATGDAEMIRNLESRLLNDTDAMNNPMSFNKHNNNGLFVYRGGVSQTKKHIAKRARSLKGITKSPEHRKKISLSKKGKPNPKISIATKGKPKPNVSKAKKGKPQPKVLCRLLDRKEMCLSHFNRWCNRQDNPEILKKIFEKTRGVSKRKDICRLADKKEMCLGHFLRWISLKNEI